MAEVAPAAVPDQNDQPPEQSTFQKIFGFISRMLTFWMIMNLFKGGSKPAVNTNVSSPASSLSSSVSSSSAASSSSLSTNPSINSHNSFRFGDHYNLFVYVTENEKYNKEDVSFFETKLSNKIFGDWEEEYQPKPIVNKIKFPDSVKSENQTLYIHAFITEPNINDDPSLVYEKSNRRCGYRNFLLTPFKKLVRHKRTANLLTGKTEKKEEDILEDPKAAPIVAHFHRNLTLNVLYDMTPFNPSTLVPPFDTFLKFTDDYRHYEPTFFFNDYWNLQRDYNSLNETVEEMEFELTIFPLSIFKFQLYASQMVQKNMMKDLLGEELAGDASDQDTLKEMLLDTNIYLVATTFLVSILHMIFEFLAFKNDIQFWNSKKDGKNLDGLSIRSVCSSIIQSVIVFLYVLENDANKMIIFNIFIGMLIDFWKIKKVLHIFKTVDGPGQEAIAVQQAVLEDDEGEKKDTDDKEETGKLKPIKAKPQSKVEPEKSEPPKSQSWLARKAEQIFADDDEFENNTPKQPWTYQVAGYTIQEYTAYRESPTKKYDRMAFKYLGYLMIPLFFGYGIYSLTYNEHKSWYSFILSMCYGFLLLFGFIMMTPQLFINYKLKSVAHLPWRMLTYKFINTFIDDLFAFVIKMPTLYRLGCFRDDIVFLIFLYQKWIYKVDYSRINEFGTTGEEMKLIEEEKNKVKPIQEKKDD